MRKKRCSQSTRSGFTLVELLVVIVIIAILAGFLVVGVMSAMAKAQRARVQAEIMNLVGGLEQYKLLYGEYPPSEPSEFQAHLERIFPRSDDSFGSGGVPAVEALTEDELLFFWLAGYDDDPKKPLTGTGERRPMYDFDLARLKDPDNTSSDPPGGYNQTRYNNRYFPRGADRPYVYFRKKSGEQNWNTGGETHKHGELRPVVRDTVAKRFQIISAGLEPEYNVETDITSFQDGTED